MNTLDEKNNPLATLNYKNWFTEIAKSLQEYSQNGTKTIFGFSGDNDKHIVVNADTIARRLVNAAPKLGSAIEANAEEAATATVNFNNAQFAAEIKKIKTALVDQLETFLTVPQSGIGAAKGNLAANPETATLSNFFSTWLTPLSALNLPGNQSMKLGFHYPFSKRHPDLKKQKLTHQHQVNKPPSLKLHKLAITVKNVTDFESQLKASLRNSLEQQFEDAEQDDLSDLLEILEKQFESSSSPSAQLVKAVSVESLGKLKKEACIQYLDFLSDLATTKQLNQKPTTAVQPPKAATKNQSAVEALDYLKDLVRRLRLFNAYLNDTNKPDDYFDLTYAGRKSNLRDLFARSDALNVLPIFPIVEGYLGETNSDRRDSVTGKLDEEQQFIFGLKMKLNGSMAESGNEKRTVFEYYSSLLQPDNHNNNSANSSLRERVLRIAFLYYFVFRNFGNKDYQPEQDLEKYLLRIFKGNDEKAKQDCLRNLAIKFTSVQPQLDQLRDFLVDIIKMIQTQAPERKEYQVQVSVRTGILNQNLNEQDARTGNYFVPDLSNTKAALQYIDVEKAVSSSSTFSKLYAAISFDGIYFYTDNTTQTFDMSYNIKGIEALPVVFLPNSDTAKITFKTFYKNYKLLVFPYYYQEQNKGWTSNSTSQFAYKFTYNLIVYFCLQIILELASEGKRQLEPTEKTDLFVPIVSLHLTDELNSSLEEEYVHDLADVLVQLLGEHYRVNAQGFNLKDVKIDNNGKPQLSKELSWRIPNGLSSLYSVLPKTFSFTSENAAGSLSLDKLAIVVVSSRVSDNKWNNSRAGRLLTMLGEIITIDKLPDQTVQVQTSNTFTANYNATRVFAGPQVLIDQVDRLYQAGYKHIFYVAHAPYTSELKLTSTLSENNGSGEQELYFMSRSLISSLVQNKPDINIYPVFYDKYYVAKLVALAVNSLYIQDTTALTVLVNDPGRKAVVFFNLFNGITVGNDRHYNGVISYATLLSVYDNILDDEAIRAGLINDRAGNKLKDSILNYVTLFHFSRYEAAPNSRRNISFKLDPYARLIGNDAVGNKLIYKHVDGKVDFSGLAFLTEVKRVLNSPEVKKFPA